MYLIYMLYSAYANFKPLQVKQSMKIVEQLNSFSLYVAWDIVF